MKKVVKKIAEIWSNYHIYDGDTLLIHSSLKRLLKNLSQELREDITSLDILESFIFILGKKGTLVLPLFNFDFNNGVTFDLKNSPSHMGKLTEEARLYEGSSRTCHPVYSFASIGYNSKKFEKIDNYSGYGKDSPFDMLKKLDSKIGIIDLEDQNSMTSYHYVEEMNNVTYRYHKEFTGKYIDRNCIESIKSYSIFVRKLTEDVETDVNRMGDLLWELGFYKGDRPMINYGLRTIKFNDLFDQTQKIIQSGKAIDYLYSLKNNIQK